MTNTEFINEQGEILEGFEELLEDAFPESYQRGMQRNRPYTGQPWTDHGARGKTEIHGITFRDLRDCFVRACCLSSGNGLSDFGDRCYEQALRGEEALLSESDLYRLPWEEIDIVAVAQNLSCEVEQLMGIFPNTMMKPEQEP